MAAGDRKGRPYGADPVGAGLAPARERTHDDGRMCMAAGDRKGRPYDDRDCTRRRASASGRPNVRNNLCLLI